MSDGSMSDVKFQEFEAKVRQYKEEKDEADTAKKVAEDLKKKADNTGKWVMAFLEEFKLTSQKTVYGTVVRNQRWSWRTPKEDAERNAFREFVEGKGQFDDLWTVNSQTLNARCKAWLDEAAESGDIDFAVPGLSEPTCTEYLSLRKK